MSTHAKGYPRLSSRSGSREAGTVAGNSGPIVVTRDHCAVVLIYRAMVARLTDWEAVLPTAIVLMVVQAVIVE